MGTTGNEFRNQGLSVLNTEGEMTYRPVFKLAGKEVLGS